MEQQIKTVSSSSCTSDSEDDGKSSGSAEMQNEVPVDPQLTRCFECLQLIDDFRYRNDAALIDELMMRWNDPSDDYESSEPYEEDQLGEYEIEGEELDVTYNYSDVSSLNHKRQTEISQRKSKLSTILE